MNGQNRVAIFVDVENLTQWIKQDGLENFLEKLSAIGPVVVRKAYARWSNTNVSSHQSILNRLGFEFTHTYHPVSGKNSADIQITVDVMEYASREDLLCIALATGDSDFSPLFRRLREQGKQVFGVGPRSPLSESVKSSCSRFFYTDTTQKEETQDEASQASALDDAVDLLEKALKTFDGPANCSALKNLMLNIDSAFDEKSLGFKSFTDFVRAQEGLALRQEGNTWLAFFRNGTIHSEPAKNTVKSESIANMDPLEQCRRILRKKGWRSLPANLLTNCFQLIKSLGALSRSSLREMTVSRSGDRVTLTDARKALTLLTKAGLMRPTGVNEEGDALWEVKPVTEREMLRTVDRTMLVRLLTGAQEAGLSPAKESLLPLFLSDHSKGEIETLLSEAKMMLHRQNQPE